MMTNPALVAHIREASDPTAAEITLAERLDAAMVEIDMLVLEIAEHQRVALVV